MKEHKQPYYKKELMLNNKSYAIEIDCVSNFSQKEGECNSLFLIRFYKQIDDYSS